MTYGNVYFEPGEEKIKEIYLLTPQWLSHGKHNIAATWRAEAEPLCISNNENVDL